MWPRTELNVTGLRGDDPRRQGHSLANLTEIMIPLLDAVGGSTVVEIGALGGDLTRHLLDWADQRGGRVIAVDPIPKPNLVQLASSRDNLTLIKRSSIQALAEAPDLDAVVIDGDHNYYTVSEELRLISERYPRDETPLVLLHDVGWPHARRDAYYAPERIPESDRQPMVEGGCLFPGEPGIVMGGLPYKWVARREGGPRNGVLTALEDFLVTRGDLRVAKIPAFYGLGVVWRRDAPWAPAVAEIVGPWDMNPVVARLEENRVYHLAHELSRRYELEVLRSRNQHMAAILRGLMGSRALKLAERLSRLRRRGRTEPWRETAERLTDNN
jgi:hypothetical protein